MSRDGGLIQAVLDDILTKKPDELRGFESFGRDFNRSLAGSIPMPRLVVESGSNTLVFRSNLTECRAVVLSFSIFAADEESLREQGARLDDFLNALAENPNPITALMPAGSSVREMDILDQQTTHEQSNVWSRSVPTEWDISLDRP